MILNKLQYEVNYRQNEVKVINMKIKEINDMMNDNKFKTPDNSKNTKKQQLTSKLHTYSSQSKLQEKARPKRNIKRVIVAHPTLSQRKKKRRENTKETFDLKNTVEIEQIEEKLDTNPEERKTHVRKISSCKPPLPRCSTEEQEFRDANFKKIENPDEHIKEIIEQLPIIDDCTDQEPIEMEIENVERELSSPRSIDNKSINSATIQYKATKLTEKDISKPMRLKRGESELNYLPN